MEPPAGDAARGPGGGGYGGGRGSADGGLGGQVVAPHGGLGGGHPEQGVGSADSQAVDGGGLLHQQLAGAGRQVGPAKYCHFSLSWVL